MTDTVTMSPGRLAATSTQPPPCGAVYVVTNSDSPPSAARRSPWKRPPCMLASIWTPHDVASIAPDSTRSGSPAASRQRATANDGWWRTWTCTGAPSLG